MKHEQVVPDYWVMLKSSATCLLLVFSGYVLIRMVQAIFWLPGYLEQNQKKLEEFVTKYSEEANIHVNDADKSDGKVGSKDEISDEAKKEK
ncbi:uncharacterized protein LOC129614480 [Condylostylus longicornis]|uniref:uncharacterized protein LOC129614480 n=1 Tax=Condylostylus longicornis TaxID=2530218 RepID=UPI00244E1E93|nr:uncharacterized protein LOC129614480 [Condylostylus longicornis]